MTSLHRVVLEWSGGSVVGRAVTVLHYSASDNEAPPVAAHQTAFTTARALFPGNVTISFPVAGDTIQDTTGDLVGVWSAPAVASVTGGASSTQAAGVGACIGWTTGGIVNGSKGPRKLRGRTFLVPISADNYQANGTLVDGALAVSQQLALDMMGTGPLAVWHRPSSATGSDGGSYGVISGRVRDKVAFLSSRRD